MNWTTLAAFLTGCVAGVISLIVIALAVTSKRSEERLARKIADHTVELAGDIEDAGEHVTRVANPHDPQRDTHHAPRSRR